MGLISKESALLSTPSPSALRWTDTVALGFSILLLVYGGYAVWVEFNQPPGIDFVSFWAAATLAAQGDPASAYDIAAHRAMELTAGPVRDLIPFPYPPPFLMLMVPLALLPFAGAFAIWLALTSAAYATASQRQMPLRYAFAHPAAHVNVLIGQAAFFFCAIFILGTAELRRRPFFGGAILGLMMLKPQLALLLPVALLAAREWRAIWGGASSAIILLGAALVVFGAQTYAAFLAILPTYSSFLGQGRIPWSELASTFAFLRFFGAPQTLALVAQGLVAVVGIAACWRAWAQGHEARVPILAAATLLVSPYLFTYDSLLLVVPLAWLLRDGRIGHVPLIWLFCLLPVVSMAIDRPYPNTIPLAALLCLWALSRPGNPPTRIVEAELPGLASERRAG